MKIAQMNTTCICGHDISFTVKKPKPFQPRIVKVVCQGCHSRYLLSCTAKGLEFLGASPSEIARQNFAGWREQL